MGSKKLTTTMQLWIAGSLVVLDQMTKIIVKNSMAYGESIPVLGDFFKFTFIENPGMAFGLRFGGRWFFAIFSLVAAFAIIYFIWETRNSHTSLRIALTLILGGAVGNLIDRMRFGRVVDFFDVDFIDIPSFVLGPLHFSGMARWPIFNVADSCVFIGMVFLIYYMLFIHSKLDEEDPQSH